jgi:hypothetical protein
LSSKYRLAALLFCSLFGACDLDERTDFLLGRECDPEHPADTCGTDDACLPHSWPSDGPRDFRCRSAASIGGTGAEPPLAYCDHDKFVCPGDTVCRADRVRPLPAGGIRREVCQLADSPFGPP